MRALLIGGFLALAACGPKQPPLLFKDGGTGSDLCSRDRWPPPSSGWLPPDGGCATTQVFWSDEICGPPVDGGSNCDTAHGDQTCYDRCCSSADCTDPARPFCRNLGFFGGTDANCTNTIHVCRATAQDDCSN